MTRLIVCIEKTLLRNDNRKKNLSVVQLFDGRAFFLSGSGTKSDGGLFFFE